MVSPAPTFGGVPFDTVSFTSDYGRSDEFVGVCHAVIDRIAPGTRVIDLAHGVRGVRWGAAALEQSAIHTRPRTVHLAVVDPGVGTARRAIAIGASCGAVLVGPDNGLLPPAAEALGGIARVWELTSELHRLQPVSSTFHGRDVFAPAAAYLALGIDPDELGPALDAASLVRLEPPHVRAVPGELVSDVLREDAFGNVQLAATADDLAAAALHGTVEIDTGSRRVAAVVGRTFADGAGGLVVFADSAGHAAIAQDAGRASELLAGAKRVRIVFVTTAKARSAEASET